MSILSHGYWEDQTKIQRLAEAHPAQVTISFDGVGEIHNLVRSRENFATRTEQTIQTLRRMRTANSLNYTIRLKTVIMRQNLDDVATVARFAKHNGLEVFYQPIEHNYNTAEDSSRFEHSETWPGDTGKAIAAVKELCELKREGFPIANTLEQLEVMIPYFADPKHSRVAVQSHTAHEQQLLCSAMTMFQIQANGDVRTCISKEAIGNIKSQPIRKIWEARPRWWLEGCCLEERLSRS